MLIAHCGVFSLQYIYAVLHINVMFYPHHICIPDHLYQWLFIFTNIHSKK